MTTNKELAEAKAIIAGLIDPFILVIADSERWACSFCGESVPYNTQVVLKHEEGCRAVVAASYLGKELPELPGYLVKTGVK